VAISLFPGITFPVRYVLEEAAARAFPEISAGLLVSQVGYHEATPTNISGADILLPKYCGNGGVCISPV
jgi:hypothetical protein